MQPCGITADMKAKTKRVKNNYFNNVHDEFKDGFVYYMAQHYFCIVLFSGSLGSKANKYSRHKNRVNPKIWSR